MDDDSTDDDPQTEAARAWTQKATDDLESAEILLAAVPPKTDVATFLCQQAAEKYLKGFLVYHAHRPPRTHNLTVLVELATRHEESLETLYAPAESLSPFAVDVRYPDADVSVSESDAVKVVEQARRIREVVLEHLSL